MNGRWVETRGSRNGMNDAVTDKLVDSANADCMYHYIDNIIIATCVRVLNLSWRGCEDIFYVCLPV